MSFSQLLCRDETALLEAIFERSNHDFRRYATGSIKRRIERVVKGLQLDSVKALQQHIASSSCDFAALVDQLTVPVSSMFRDSAYFLALRRVVVPFLKTLERPRIWIAGCSTGEEAYSLGVLLHEQGILERCSIYATDINALSIGKATRAIFPIASLRGYIENYHRSGGVRAFSNYYYADYDHFVMDSGLRRHISFAEHSLATGGSCGAFDFISCRNTLIYFDRALKERALAMFSDSLARGSFMGLGLKESLQLNCHCAKFEFFDREARLFRKK